MQLSQKKKELIEEVGIYLEERANLSPLASRIYALLILSCHEGLSFDAIVKGMQASKSSISSNINVLLQLGYIEFYTKHGDRKRYFRTSDSYLKNTLEQQAHLLKKSLKIIAKINHFNEHFNSEKFKKEQTISNLYETLLKDQLTKINETLIDFKKIKNQA